MKKDILFDLIEMILNLEVAIPSGKTDRYAGVLGVESHDAHQLLFGILSVWNN